MSLQPEAPVLRAHDSELTTYNIRVIHGGEGIFPGAPGAKLYYQWWRPANGESRAALATVHGAGRFAELCDLFIDQLVPAGYRLYVFDHRPLGHLPGQRGYVQEWGERLEDVHAFVRLIGARVDGLPVFLVGNHVGALMALSHALRHPDGLAGVVALGPAVPAPARTTRAVRLERRLTQIWPAPTDAAFLQGTTAPNGNPDSQRVPGHLEGTRNNEADPPGGPDPSGTMNGLADATQLADLPIPHVVIGSEAQLADGYPDGLVTRIAAWLEARIPEAVTP